MEVLSWKLPSYITQSDGHYYGQMFAMEDCLFRSINHLDFVVFNDLDEYIVPLQYVNISSTLLSIQKENITVIAFRVQNLSYYEARDKLHGQ